jgi:uncharacterized protein YecE (DUF72 family)
VRSVLTERNIALYVADRRGPITPLWRTAEWTYLRFHAGRAAPRSCYSFRELAAWAERLEAGWGREVSGFVYFNNDGNGCALRDAGVFTHALDERGVEVASLPVVAEDVLPDPGLFSQDDEGRASIGSGRCWRSARRALPGPSRSTKEFDPG